MQNKIIYYIYIYIYFFFKSILWFIINKINNSILLDVNGNIFSIRFLCNLIFVYSYIILLYLYTYLNV